MHRKTGFLGFYLPAMRKGVPDPFYEHEGVLTGPTEPTSEEFHGVEQGRVTHRGTQMSYRRLGILWKTI